jgi:hypothetical protein
VRFARRAWPAAGRAGRPGRAAGWLSSWLKQAASKSSSATHRANHLQGRAPQGIVIMRAVRAFALVLFGSSSYGVSSDRPVASRSRLRTALGGQSFVVNVTSGGAAVLSARANMAHLSTITSTFSEPGPIYYNFSESAAEGWSVQVDRSREASGVWTVRASAKTYRVSRTYTLDPDPQNPRRVLVNDTISTPSGLGAEPLSTGLPGPTDVVGISIKHTATVADTAADVEAALTPGTYGAWQCGSIDNPGDTCASPCADPYVKYTNIGRPDVFANRSGFGIGLTALDDVFRVHAQTHQTAKAAAPRMEKMMNCPVSDPPAISLADLSFGIKSSGDEYTLEWAIYPFVDTEDDEEASSCTDYYCFVNAQRHDLQSHTITINQTGFLGPGSSAHGDLSPYNGTGYTQCFDDSNTSCAIPCQREIATKSCWEHWSPEEWLAYLQKQAGPGGNAHLDNEDMIGDAPHGCGQLDINGNRFVDPKQRPQDYDDYQWQVINLTKAANALLPPGAPTHQVLRYVDTYSSTGVNDSVLFPDSLVTARDGQQQVYENCTKPGGPQLTQMSVFFADGANSFSDNLDEYFALSFAMGADGIFHDGALNCQY